MNHGSRWAPRSPAELAGNDPAGVVDQPFRQNDCRRQVMPRCRERAGDRCDRGPITGLRSVGVEPRRKIRPAGEHDVVAGRVVVRAVRERADQRPQVATLGQERKMFADLDSGRVRRDRAKLASNLGRRIRLQVEALELRQTTREEDVDDRAGSGSDSCLRTLIVIRWRSRPLARRGGESLAVVADWFIPSPRSPIVPASKAARRRRIGGWLGTTLDDGVRQEFTDSRSPGISRSFRLFVKHKLNHNLAVTAMRLGTVNKLECSAYHMTSGHRDLRE